MISSRSMIAVLAVALLVACHEPDNRESISDEESDPDLRPVPTRCSHEDEAAQDPQSLVGRNWNVVRPTPCLGETLLHSRKPLRSYALPTWRGRTLFVYRKGGPRFEVVHTEGDRRVDSQPMRANLEILGVLDLGAFDWKTRVVSGGVVDDVVCWDPRDGGPSGPGLVVGIVELRRVSYEVFPPERAWKWNEQERRFEAVDDPSHVSCRFQEQGDTPLEAWRESWDGWGRPNFQCEIATSPET